MEFGRHWRIGLLTVGCWVASDATGARAGIGNAPAFPLAATRGLAATFARTASGPSERIVHSFGTLVSDGSAPGSGALLALGGMLYGTTSNGRGSARYGAVYGVTPAGAERVIYRFTGDGLSGHIGDGIDPQGSLTYAGGLLYGTTEYGGLHAAACGAQNCGTVFGVTLGGSERFRYRFRAGAEGFAPTGGVVALNGALYGTTMNGGDGACPGQSCGTVFEIAPNGTERVVHRFAGADGSDIAAGLLAVNGLLYGTAAAGGLQPALAGTVFAVSPAGGVRVLHDFVGPDGSVPQSTLVDVNATLYGTTIFGGAYGLGTVFAISPAGIESVVHSFGGGSDGAFPFAGLTAVNGRLYGTTESGGAYHGGTVFEICSLGERVLHSFAGPPDGLFPFAPLTYDAGALYGTTVAGGNSGYSAGTVFAISLNENR